MNLAMVKGVFCASADSEGPDQPTHEIGIWTVLLQTLQIGFTAFLLHFGTFLDGDMTEK